MCASYGLLPDYDEYEWRDLVESEVLEPLRVWAEANGGQTLLPTGIQARNLNPILTSPGRLTLGWWGYLAGGAAARFPSINSRSERLAQAKGPLPARAIVPASFWREFRKPGEALHHLDYGGRLLGMAAVIRPGLTADGELHTCYSLVMQPAAPQIADTHDRMPLLIPPGFAQEWLESTAPAAELLAAAASAARPLSQQIVAHPQATAFGAEPLF